MTVAKLRETRKLEKPVCDSNVNIKESKYGK